MGQAPVWLKFIPFFLAATFFISRIFAILSPLPLMFMVLRGVRYRWLLLASITNSAIVYFATGPSDLLLFQVCAVAVAWVLPFLLKRARSLERAAVWTWISMVVTALLILGVHSAIHNVNPVRELKTVVYQTLDQTLQSLPAESQKDWLGDKTPAEWKQGIWVEVPWSIGIFALALVCINLIIVVRLNTGDVMTRLGIGPDYFRRWKTPEWLVWPTLLSGFILVVGSGTSSHIALNVFKFAMAIYALQGLSILGFFIELWKVRGLFRLLAYVVAVSLMMPLILSIGFFDLWFDFRAKVRQS